MKSVEAATADTGHTSYAGAIDMVIRLLLSPVNGI